MTRRIGRKNGAWWKIVPLLYNIVLEAANKKHELNILLQNAGSVL